MTLFDWLLAKKPYNTTFFVRRNFQPTSANLFESEMMSMAKLILDAVKYHTDNNFISEPLPDITVQLGNVYLFDYEGCQFGLATNGQEMSVGAMFSMPERK